MIKKIIYSKIDSITTAALLVALSSLLSRFLGVFRDRILAGEFGAGDTLDIYYAAFKIPDMIFNLLVLGALSAGFIPIFTSLLKSEDTKNHEDAWRLASNVTNILGAALIVISMLAIIFTSFLVKIFAPGFGPEKMELTVALTRIMFLSPFFLGLSSVLGGILQSFKRFFSYSLAPIFYNIGIIFGALYLVPVFGIKGLAWGVVLGSLLHFLIQVPSVVQLGFRYRFSFKFNNDHVRKIGRLMIPRTLSLAISQIDLLVSTAIASTLASGSLAVFNFANNLQTFPIGIFGISFATAVFPTLSQNAKDKDRLIKTFSATQRQILFFIIPATILFMVLPAQIIRVVYGSGKFNWENTVLTINTLSFFTISLFAQASIPLLVRMFYARQNSKKPFYIGLISVIVNICLSIWLSGKMSVSGLALAFSISNIINFILLWVFLRIDMGGLDEIKILISTFKFSVAALAGGLVAQSMKSIIWPVIDMTKFLGVFIQGFIAGISGIIIYILICMLLRSEELFGFWNGIKRKISFKKAPPEDQIEARGI